MKQTLKHSISTILLGSVFAATLGLGCGKLTALGAENDQAILSLTAKDENKVEHNTEAIYEEISYQILDVKITREIGEHEKENIYYNAEETDETGNLTGAQQYLWITMKIKNLANTEKEVWMNKRICNITSENFVLNTIAEARYISPDVKGMADSHRFFYDLKSNEEAEIVIGYILDETYTYDSPLYYCLSSDNNYSDDLFLYLGELTERMAEPSTPEAEIVNEMKEAKAQETEMSFEELVAWEQGAEFANLAAFTTTDAHMADLNTAVLTENILYQITEVEIGKEIGDHDQSLIDYGNIAKDENGNITDKASFIWITMKLKNYGSEEQSFWLNKHLFGIDENNTVYETLSSVKYIDPVQEDAKPYQELFLTLQGGEEREVTLGYIIADESEANCRSDLPLYYRTEIRGDKPSLYLYVGELGIGNE